MLTTIIILTAFGSLALLLKLANIQDRIRLNERLNHQRALAEMEYGDFPAIPEGMRLARNAEGGVRDSRGRAVTGQLVAHHDGSGIACG